MLLAIGLLIVDDFDYLDSIEYFSEVGQLNAFVPYLSLPYLLLFNARLHFCLSFRSLLFYSGLFGDILFEFQSIFGRVFDEYVKIGLKGVGNIIPKT